MKTFFIACRRFFGGLVFYWLSGMTIWVGGRLLRPVAYRPTLWIAVGTFLVGLIYLQAFCRDSKIQAIYVFGHEMTHYLWAKLFWKKTGKIRIHSNSGYVEIQNPNVWITLAPYFFPLYLVLFLGVEAIVLHFWKWPPPEFPWVCSWILGLIYAFYWVMNCYVLQKEQQDIAAYGKFFSYALIAWGNLFFLLVALLVATSQWQKAWNLTVSSSLSQWHWLLSFFR